MIEHIKRHTRAYVKKIDIDDTHPIFLDISHYKYNQYTDYVIHLLNDHEELVETFSKQLRDNKIILECNNGLKKIKGTSGYVVILPINDLFHDDYEEVLFKTREVSISDLRKLISNISFIIYMIIPLLGMLLLSKVITSYSRLFNVPTDTIDLSLQVNFLYKLMLSVGSILIEGLLNPKFIVFFISIGILVQLLEKHIYKNILFKIIRTSPILMLKLSLPRPRHVKEMFIILCVSIVSTGILYIIQSVKYIQDIQSDKFNKSIEYIIEDDPENQLLLMMIAYNESTIFPQYLKLKNGKTVIVKGMKDDLIYYYTFDDFFENLKSEENNNTVYKRLCNNSEKFPINILHKFHEYNLIFGLTRPKSNIAPTSILVESENIIDEYYEQADKYKENICKK